MVETIWDWMFVFYCSAALGMAALLFIYWSKPKPPIFPPEWVCDGCGQVCSHLHQGLCDYCDKAYKSKTNCI
jgi:hypothetical protein